MNARASITSIPITPKPGLISVILVAGNSVQVTEGTAIGGWIINPASAIDQGISRPDILYVDPTGPASVSPNGTSMALAPGTPYYAIPGSTLPLSVASNIPNHAFISVQWI